MNRAYRDVRHNLLRFILTCLGLSLLMAVVLAMMGIYNGLAADDLNIVRAPKADLWVVEAGRQGPFAESSKIPGETQGAVARLHGVRDAGSITYQTVEAPFAGRSLRLYIIGYERGRPGGPDVIVEGRGLAQSHFEAVADRKSGLEIGDSIVLGRNRSRSSG
ncbi:ABC transporter permease [Rhizobium terricola]|uniref:ABC transporter permease n=1 Tax=Rhizobium terricola TaxID=2728849 RepID=UPI001981BE5B|nr:ABC transporter permease [Rhizobium terricola]